MMTGDQARISEAGLSLDDFDGPPAECGPRHSIRSRRPERAVMALTANTDVDIVRRYIRTAQLSRSLTFETHPGVVVT